MEAKPTRHAGRMAEREKAGRCERPCDACRDEKGSNVSNNDANN